MGFYGLQWRRSQPFFHTCAINTLHLLRQYPSPAPTVVNGDGGGTGSVRVSAATPGSGRRLTADSSLLRARTSRARNGRQTHAVIPSGTHLPSRSQSLKHELRPHHHRPLINHRPSLYAAGVYEWSPMKSGFLVHSSRKTCFFPCFRDERTAKPCLLTVSLYTAAAYREISRRFILHLGKKFVVGANLSWKKSVFLHQTQHKTRYETIS